MPASHRPRRQGRPGLRGVCLACEPGACGSAPVEPFVLGVFLAPVPLRRSCRDGMAPLSARAQRIASCRTAIGPNAREEFPDANRRRGACHPDRHDRPSSAQVSQDPVMVSGCLSTNPLSPDTRSSSSRSRSPLTPICALHGTSWRPARRARSVGLQSWLGPKKPEVWPAGRARRLGGVAAAD